jgi:hypothetical protein
MSDGISFDHPGRVATLSLGRALSDRARRGQNANMFIFWIIIILLTKGRDLFYLVRTQKS